MYSSTMFNSLRVRPSTVTSNWKSMAHRASGTIGHIAPPRCRSRGGGLCACGRAPGALLRARAVDPLVVDLPALAAQPLRGAPPPPPRTVGRETCGAMPAARRRRRRARVGRGVGWSGAELTPCSGPGVVRVRCPRLGRRRTSIMAKRRRHTPDQIIRKLAEGTKLLAGGAELDEVCQHLEIAKSTWHRWLTGVSSGGYRPLAMAATAPIGPGESRGSRERAVDLPGVRADELVLSAARTRSVPICSTTLA